MKTVLVSVYPVYTTRLTLWNKIHGRYACWYLKKKVRV